MEFTTALTKLLSNRDLRREFEQNPGQIADQLDLNDSDRAALLELDIAAVNQQAQGLLTKRFHHASQFLPITMQRLGGQARSLFLEFAQQYWPTGHRRHLHDAVAFCDWLSAKSRDRKLSSRPCRSEWNRLRFEQGERRFALFITTDLVIGGRRRRGIQLLFRRWGNIRQWCWFV